MSQQTQLKQIAKRGGGGSVIIGGNNLAMTQAQGVPSQNTVAVPLNLMGSSTIEQKLLSNVDASITQITAEALASSAANAAVHQKQLHISQSTTPFTANSSGQPASKAISHFYQTSIELQKTSYLPPALSKKKDLSLGSTPYKTPSGKAPPQLKTPSSVNFGKTPQQTISLQNTDYYSVQSNSSSRNVSATQAQTTGPTKNKVPSGSQIRNNVASRNAAVPTSTMIKSSHIVVTPVTGKKAYLQNSDSRQYKNLMNQTVSALFPTSNQRNAPTGSPNQKGKDSRLSITGSQSNLSMNYIAGSGGVSPLPQQPSTDTDHNKAKAPSGSRYVGFNEKQSQRYKATSQERQRQRQASNDTGIYLNQKLNQAYKATINQKLAPNQLNRRTSTIGASPMALCAQHQKPPILSPNKSLLQKQVLSTQKERYGNHSISNISHYYPQSKNEKASVFESKSVVLATDVPSQTSIHYSPKQSIAQQNIFKSPSTQSSNQLHKKSTFQVPSHPIILGQGSPSLRATTGNMSSKVATQRHSTGGNGFSGQVVIIGESSNKKSKFGGSGSSITYQQTSRVIHSKVVKNLNNHSLNQNQTIGLSPDNCLKIDLNQITTNTAAKKNSVIIASSPTNDDYCDNVDVPFALYGDEQVYDKKKGPATQGIPQPAIVQLNSTSPKATQFFSKSPKMTSQNATGNNSTIHQQPSFPSSNRHSLIQHAPLTPVINPVTATQQVPVSTQRTARQQLVQQTTTFQLQTKSSLAKKGAAVPSKVAQEAQQQMVQKSKTQRIVGGVKNSQQKTMLLSKVPLKSGETSTKKLNQNEAGKADQAINKQVFEIVPPPSILRDNGNADRHVIEVNLIIAQEEEAKIHRDSTPQRHISRERYQEQDNEQDISPPKETSVSLPDESAYFTASQSPNKNVGEYPMATCQFIAMHRGQLKSEQQEELEKYPLIYFPGLTLAGDNQEAKPEAQEKKVSKHDDEDGYFRINIGDHLLYRYEIIKILGKGSFAQVIQCLDHLILLTEGRERHVAIKITRNTELDHKFAQGEAKLLQYLMQNDPNDEYNIVRLYEEFVFREHHCFVFELLPKGDLFEHLKESGFSGFGLTVIRQYAYEILKALVFLEKHKIIHCDLKPENILLISDESGKSRVKVVDFGSGSFRGEQVYTYVQSRFYRAPEVILRLMPPPTSYSEKVDIWSLGCILAELFTGEPIFPGNNEQEQLELIMEIFGIPESDLIDKCRKKEHYFDVDYSPFLIEDEEQGILRIPESKKLEQVIKSHDMNFLDFIKKCLALDPELRIAASEAIEHPWIKNEPIIGTRIELSRLSSLGDNSISQDDVFAEGRGLTAPDESESESEDRNLTMRGSDNNFLFIQETNHKPNKIITALIFNGETLQQNHFNMQSNHQLMSVSSSQAAFINASNSLRGRRDEDLESGARGTQFEESPVREPNFEKPKKSLAQLTQSASQFSIKPRYIADIKEAFVENLQLADIELKREHVLIDLSEETEARRVIEVESVPRTPPILEDQKSHSHKKAQQEEAFGMEHRFLLMPVLSAEDLPQSPQQSSHSHEKRRDRSQRKKEHSDQPAATPQKGELLVQKSPHRDIQHLSHQDMARGIEVIGKYEIFREDERKQVDVRDSVTSGIAMEANIPPVNNHSDQNSLKLVKADPVKGGIQAENTINKITITFYQKRGTASSDQHSKALSSGPAQPKKK